MSGPGDAFADTQPPPGAREFGMDNLALSSTFSDLAEIDLDATGAPGSVWYPRAPWSQPTSPRGDFSIGNDDSGSFLRIAPTVNNTNWSLSTMDPNTGSGRTFNRGYFEIRMRFVPPPPATPGGTPSWPSFWGLSRADAQNQQPAETAELDIFEAMAGNGVFKGHAHHTISAPDKVLYSNSNNTQSVPADFNQWHTYAAAWSGPANGYSQSRISWYLDDEWLMTQNFGEEGPWPKPLRNWEPAADAPSSTFRIFDNADLVIALGSGIGNPMDVQWVRIWQA